jgi:hypothetical protein
LLFCFFANRKHQKNRGIQTGYQQSYLPGRTAFGNHKKNTNVKHPCPVGAAASEFTIQPGGTSDAERGFPKCKDQISGYSSNHLNDQVARFVTSRMMMMMMK